MEQFIVSARKYRPSTFDTVVGQGHITTTLKNAIGQNHLAQAFLFCGPRGVGKTTCARILAKTINCQNLSPETEACNTCDSCRSFNGNASFNVHELDAASNNSVDDIRNLVDQVRYPPQAGRYKIYIIDEVHMLSNAAFNAFLKTLEEPPSYAIFILATTEKHKIIPTILSRCQIFDFNRIGISDISKHLARIARKEEIRAEEEALQLIAQKADGGLRDALSMFDLITTFSTDRSISYVNTIANLHILDYDYYFRITDALLAGRVGPSWVLFDEILKKGFDGHNFMVGLCEHFRNLLVCKDAATVQLLQVSGSVQQKYLQQAAGAPVAFLATAMHYANECDQGYKASKNAKLLVELALMKMAHIPAAVNLARLVQDNGDLLKKKDEHSPGVTGVPTPVVSVNPVPANGTPVNGTHANGTAVNGTHGTPNGANGNGAHGATYPVNGNGKPTNGVHESGANGYKATTPVAKATPSLARPTISLNPNVPAVSTQQQANAPAPTQQFIGEAPYTPEQLRTQWEAFSRTRNAPTEELILNRGYQADGHTLHLTLDNQIQMDSLNAMRMDLLEFLRRTLNNRHIQVKAELGAVEIRKSIYTNQEKFKYLSQKHPVLSDLRTQLGLEIE
ncbi:MAG: DNA polymerase III subunits gamma and tau [uncultured Cytophagales bacterium]|uniref:DNA polymerase III subunit gamma/tau n=1 Tax=uncultured Cytophagales bacterium TaxID=158755 RepID=A0A6J4KEA0_9SPHI|nr:MAG: DNA polymerase III subunits gamma and tau [uncultured Cytophagales bacterium]